MNNLELKPEPRRGVGPDQALCTPPDLFASLSEIFGPFDLDACASENNALCSRWFSEESNALAHPWSLKTWGVEDESPPLRAFLNPPFAETSGCGDFVRKALAEALAGRCSTLVCIPGYKREFDWWAEAVAGVNGPGATGILDVSGGRVDFWRGGQPVGQPNQRITFVWFQAGEVSRHRRDIHGLPWTGTVRRDGYVVRLPRCAGLGGWCEQ